MDLSNIQDVKNLKGCLMVTFGSPQGQETMKFIEKIGSWFPTIMDSHETNDIIARDANRRLIGTIKTIMDLEPEQIVALAEGSI